MRQHGSVHTAGTLSKRARLLTTATHWKKFYSRLVITQVHRLWLCFVLISVFLRLISRTNTKLTAIRSRLPLSVQRKRSWEFPTSRFMLPMLSSLNIVHIVVNAGSPLIQNGRSAHSRPVLRSRHRHSALLLKKRLHLCFPCFHPTLNWRHVKHFKKFLRQLVQRCHSCLLVQLTSPEIPVQNSQRQVHIRQTIVAASRSITEFVNMQWELQWLAWRYMAAYFLSAELSLFLLTTCDQLFD